MTTRKTKGERIHGLVKIVRTWTACVGSMAWESPFIKFEMQDGTARNYMWLTDDESWLYRTGELFFLDAFYYDDKERIRRVKVTELTKEELVEAIKKSIIKHFVTEEETMVNKIDFSKEDDYMDSRSCYYELENDLTVAVELASRVDYDLKIQIQRLISLESKKVECSHCGSTVHPDDIIYLDVTQKGFGGSDGDAPLCQECFRIDHTFCDECGRQGTIDDMVECRGVFYHKDCVDQDEASR